MKTQKVSYSFRNKEGLREQKTKLKITSDVENFIYILFIQKLEDSIDFWVDFITKEAQAATFVFVWHH